MNGERYKKYGNTKKGKSKSLLGGGAMKKSAKDLAFEKERAKFRKEIRETNSEVLRLRQEIRELKETIQMQEEELRQSKEWIDRLLEYTELTEDEMHKVIKSQKAILGISEDLAALNSFFGNVSSKYMN